MSERIEALYTVGSQVVSFDTPEGRPYSTPTVAVATSGGTALTAATTTGVTTSTVNTTINATAAVGAKQLVLSATTGVEVGGTYLVTNALGQSERVRVRGITSGSKTIDLDEPLEYAYAATNTFVGTGFVYTLATADVATLAEANVITATYIVASGGRTYTIRKLYDVVRFPLKNPVTVEAVKQRWPDVMAQEPEEQRGEDFGRQRTVAFERVQRVLREQGRRPSLIVDVATVEDWACWEFALILQEGGVRVMRGLEPSEAIDRIEKRLERAKAAALAMLRWYDGDDDGVLGENEAASLQLDLVR